MMARVLLGKACEPMLHLHQTSHATVNWIDDYYAEIVIIVESARPSAFTALEERFFAEGETLAASQPDVNDFSDLDRPSRRPRWAPGRLSTAA